MTDAGPRPRYSTSYALIVGINNYAATLPVGYAVNDAEEVASCFIGLVGVAASESLNLR